MSNCTLTLVGIERALNRDGDTLFTFGEPTPLIPDIARLPEGIDAELLKNTILERASSFESVWTEPSYLKFRIPLFFNTNYESFKKMNEVLNAEYNPLENFDRMEDYTDTSRGNGTTRNTGSSSTDSDSTSNTDDLTSAYNVTALQNTGRSENVMSSNDSTETTSNTESENEAETIHQGRLHGNIGVTTSQQMLESEMTLRSKYNIYKMITDRFISEFCILIY